MNEKMTHSKTGFRVLAGAILTSMLALAQGTGAYRVTSFAGVPRPAGSDVAATDLTLSSPIGVARDSLANLYVADYGNHRVLRVTPAGRATVIAGTGTAGSSGNGGPATKAQLQYPRTLALDGDKYLYVGEPIAYRVRRIDLTTGIITLVVGDGQNRFNGDGNTGPASSVSEVLGLAVDGVGNLIIADTGNHRIRRLSAADGRVTTIAGTGVAGFAGDGGAPTAAQLNRPAALAIGANGDVYFSELGNGRIRRISGGVVSTVAGLLQATAHTGDASQVRIYACTGMALNGAGTALYFTDEDTDTVRMLEFSSRQISLVAGTGTQGYSGDNGTALQAELANPNHIAVDSGGLVVADTANNRIRRIGSNGVISTIAGGATLNNGDGGPASQAMLNRPTSLKLDSLGDLIITDSGDCLIRRVDTAGRIVTLAGIRGTCQLPGLIAAAADTKGYTYWITTQGLYVRGPSDPLQGRQRISYSYSDILLSRDEQRIYLLDRQFGNARVWVVGRDVVTGQGIVPEGPVAGTSTGSGGDGGPAVAKVLFLPQALAEDATGNVYILDSGNRNIRQVDRQKGTISTVVLSTFLAAGVGLTIDPANRAVVTAGNQVLSFTTLGALDAVVGSGDAGYTADGVDGRLALLNTPLGIAAGADGTVYVADSANHTIRSLSPVMAVSMEALNATASASGTVPAQVRVIASDHAPLDGIRVQFSITPASAQLSAASAITDAHGIASVDVTLGGAAAVVTATVDGLPPVLIDVTNGLSGGRGMLNLPLVTAAISLSQFGGAAKVAPGGWMEVYGANLATDTVQWAGKDFQNNVAPVALGGTRVLMNGIPAFLSLVSPGQINCVAPDGIGVGDVSIVVSNNNGTSDAFKVAGAARAPSLLAPASFRRGDLQYVTALFADGTYVGPDGLIAGAPFRPATAGDRLLLYGVGFGATVPATPAGQIAGQAAKLPNLEVRFGDVPVTVEYGGPAGGYVGLYQFNVVVPVGVSGDVRLTVTVDGVPVEQELWITIK